MRLRLNICDVDMQLKIKNWKKPSPGNEYEWADTELFLRSKYLNYDPSGEILMNDEILDLCYSLDALLTGKMQSDCEMSFAEPDLEFKFSVAKRLYSEPGGVWYRDGYRDFDIELAMYIKFWCTDGLGTNQFKMVFDREEIEALCVYLKMVIGELPKDDPAVEKLIRQGLLLPE